MSGTANDTPLVGSDAQPSGTSTANESGQPKVGSSATTAADGIEEVPSVGDWRQTRTMPSEGQADAPPSSEAIAPTRLEEIICQLELHKLLEHRGSFRPGGEREKAWSDTADMVKTYSDDMIARWNAQVDTYLVFAGLFSAILTAFNVQSYPLLQPASGALDSTALALQQISMQLQSFAISPPFINSTNPSIAASAAPSTRNPSPVIPRYAIWLNILWFSGLILSLASTVVAILVKQWLSEYSSGLTGISREAARLRQYRLNNLEKWRVGDIIVLVPVLLLVSLGLFLSGLLVLLWTLHPAVAIVASVLVGTVAFCTIGVIVLPLFKHDCAYLSPQTFALNSLWKLALRRPLQIISFPLNAILFIPFALLVIVPTHVPGKYFPSVDFPVVSRILYRVDRYFAACFTIHWSIGSWRGHERSVINQLSDALDVDILLKAYNATLDADAVSSAAICLLEQPIDLVLDYFSRLYQSVKGHFGSATWSYPKNDLLACQVLLCVADTAATLLHDPRDPSQPIYDLSSLGQFGRHDPKYDGDPAPDGGDTQATSDPWLQKTASWFTSSHIHRSVDMFYAPVDRILGPYLRKLSNPTRTADRDRDLQNIFGDTGPSRSVAIDLLYQETVRCLQAARSRSPSTGFQQVRTLRAAGIIPCDRYLKYLRSVDEYLRCASALPASINADQQNCRKVLQAFCDFLLDADSEGLFPHTAWRDYPHIMRGIVETLNTHYDTFKYLPLIDFSSSLDFYQRNMKNTDSNGHSDSENDVASILNDLRSAVEVYNTLYSSGRPCRPVGSSP